MRFLYVEKYFYQKNIDNVISKLVLQGMSQLNYNIRLSEQYTKNIVLNLTIMLMFMTPSIIARIIDM